MDEDIYDRWGMHIDPKTPGGIRQEALRRAAAGPPAAPTMFRIWQERQDPGVRVEEIVDENEEVTQRLKAGTIKEEPIVVESHDEAQEVVRESASTILERMEDLLAKVGRYQDRLRAMCEKAREWEMSLPEVMLYGSGPESSSGPQGCPSEATVGAGPRLGMTFRPPTSHGRVPQAAQIRGQSKATTSQGPSQAPSRAPPRKDPEPERRKEVVEVQEEEDEGDDEEDERLRQEEDRRAEQRAKKRGAQGGVEPSLHDGVPKRKKYAVRLEEDFDVERMVDKLQDGHNDLMNLKDILASAPRLRGELKGRLSRRLVPNVHLSSILPREIEWTEAGTRMDWKCVVDLKVRDQPSIAMVDTGAKMNIIRERDATMLGLEVDHSDHGVLHGANYKAIFCGTASNVMVEIGRVRARMCFFAIPDVDHPILLGRSFLCRTETFVFNRHEGTMILTLSDPACRNYEIIKCRNTRPGSARNRLNLGSFTFEESEYAWRGLREEQEGEGAGEVLSLGLNDVNKAMEVVKAHDMADPEAIKALREQDLQRMNAVTVRDAGGLPNADALSESCARRSIISLINLYSGYDQFLVYPPDRSVTAMHTPRGLFHMNVAPQGWTNAVAMVQGHMIRVMQTVSPHITQPYIDDLAVKGPKEKEEDEVMPGVRRFVWKHVQDIDKVLGLLEEHNLTASGPKSKHCMREATILGFVCNKRGRRPDVKKMDKIVEWSVPFQSITNVRSFLGTCGFWRIFVKDFATKSEHLRKLVRQDQEWVWGEDQKRVVERMKREFKEGGLVSGAPNYEAIEEKPFIVETDSGPTALGGVLIQADADGKERPLRDTWSSGGGKDDMEGPTQVEEHEQLMGGMYLLTNTLLQGNFGQRSAASSEEGELLIPESQDDEFEEGEIREAFRAEEYDGIYRELGLLLSCEMRDSDASAKAQKMRHLYVVRDGHLFIKRLVGNPRRIVCGRNRQIDVIAALHDGIAGGHRGVSATCAKISELYHWDGMLTMVIKYCQSCVPCQQRSDFSKAVMQRGGRDTRPCQGPQRMEGRGEQHKPPRREPTPEFDDDNIELFLDVYRDHAAQRGWSVAERIHHLRGIGRFEESVAQICEEALTWPDVEAGMQRLRASPRGRDGMPIRLEEGNADEFIPAYEHYMLSLGVAREEWVQAILIWTRQAERQVAKQIQKRARDWEDCQAQLRRAFGRPQHERHEPRVERRWRSKRPREPAPREAGLAKERRGAPAQREDEPAGPALAEESFPACGLRAVEFRRITSEELRPPSPLPSTQELDIPREMPFRSLATHLGVSRWEASRMGEGSVEPACYVPLEEPLDPEMETDMRDREEPQDPEMAAERPDPVRPQGREVITVGDDTPPCSPAPEPAQRSWPEGIPEPGSEEIPEFPPEATTIPEQEAEAEDQGIEPTPPVEPKTSEQRIDELWARYESQRDAARQRSREAGRADEETSELREMGDLGFSATRQAIERMDQRLCETAVTSFQWYNLLRNELRVKELEVEHLTTQLAEERARSQAREVEWERRFEEMAAAVDRLSAAWEASQVGRAGADGQGWGMRASPSQGAAVEVPRQSEPMEEVPLDAIEEEGGAQESLMAMSTERRGSRLHELAAAMGIGTPQERSQRLDTPEDAPRLGKLRTELGSWATETDSGEPGSRRQQQQEVMSEPTAIGGPQPSGVCRDEAVLTERAHEEGPRELGTPGCRPVSTAIREGGGVEAMEHGPQGHVGLPSCHEVTTETMGMPSTSSSQGRKKKTGRWHDASCLWCKEEGHRAVDCPKLLEDKAEGRVAEFNDKFYDRQGRIVERAPDGGRAQLYRQNQVELCK
ncbi:hypothetical protein CBR_g19646 [Chara braunii]|uniref:CCHC-type domain-containing protein n=1 Tax=Chara braunii TaxID=69332 RepID=A0A388KYW0_CHABU|nr:hypothetical protein CBR_g19646 [Chara braunii]|eukprot:GBG75133.1 hypothetical protein CBR_g19646 [Chara braunii]